MATEEAAGPRLEEKTAAVAEGVRDESAAGKGAKTATGISEQKAGYNKDQTVHTEKRQRCELFISDGKLRASD